MEAMKEFLEMMESERKRTKITEKWSDGERTEDVEKMSSLEQKMAVYVKWKELVEEFTDLKASEADKFTDFLQVAVKAQKIFFKFSALMDSNNFDDAEKMIEDIQTSRNELAAAAIKFLGV